MVGFVEICLDDTDSDQRALSQLETELTKQGANNKIVKVLNEQLDNQSTLEKKGTINDDRILDSPLKPKGSVGRCNENDSTTEARKDVQKTAKETEHKRLKTKKTEVDNRSKMGKNAKKGYSFKKSCNRWAGFRFRGINTPIQCTGNGKC